MGRVGRGRPAADHADSSRQRFEVDGVDPFGLMASIWMGVHRAPYRISGALAAIARPIPRALSAAARCRCCDDTVTEESCCGFLVGSLAGVDDLRVGRIGRCHALGWTAARRQTRGGVGRSATRADAVGRWGKRSRLHDAGVRWSG